MLTQKSALERGSRLGKYEIHGRLSVGGMAELYLASLTGQGGFQKFVALKRVLPTIAENESFRQMFLDEARITASLTHASIAQVYELTEDPDTREPILAMEFIAGQNVEQIVARAKAKQVAIPTGFTVRLAYDVLLALHFAHGFVEPVSGKSMPVIHRDINPRNVMVTYTGGTKIVDFGIAKARGRLNETQVGYVKGTLQYMSPEQVTAKEVDGRADLFAASILFHELLSGRRLIDAASDAVAMHRIVDAHFPSPREANPSLSQDLVEVVMKGLARDPNQRWRTGRDYARALDRAFDEPFDDEQMGELMGQLFPDKVEFTRSLLASSSSQASIADLRVMTMGGDELDITAPQPVSQRPTSPNSATQATEQNLEPIGPAVVVSEPPPPRKRMTEMPTTIGRKPTSSEQAAATAAPPRKRTVEAPQAAPPPRTRSRADAEVKPAPVANNNFTTTLGIVVLVIAFLFAVGFLLWGRTEDPESVRPLEHMKR